ncbi:cytochrome P450 [Halenospora varia]|nr:cytochrome P450 [Halenospora varia]
MLQQQQRRRDKAVRDRGCQPVAKFQTKEPFFGFDVKMAMHIDIPSLYRHHQRFGKTFQVNALVSIPEVCTLETENIRVLMTNGKDWGVEPLRLDGMEYLCGRGFLTTDGDMWNHSRKLLKPTFARNNLLDLGTLSKELDRLLDQVPNDGSTIDLAPGLSNMFLATSMDFLLGILSTDETPREAPCTPQVFLVSFQDAIVRTMFRILLGRFWVLAPKAKYLRNCKVSHDFIDFYVNEAMQDNKPLRGDDAVEAIPKQSMIRGLSAQTDDKHHIRSQILQGMLASGETISALLANTLLLLSRYPSYWQKIRTEALKRGSKLADFDALQDCKLVQNILRESFRLRPVFPLLSRNALCDTTLPSGGGPDQKDTIFIPKGTLVVMSYFSLHRDPSVFGDDVENFRPERWDTIRVEQWEFMPFGGGGRACLGEHKVLVEATYVLLRMAATFESLECRDTLPWKGELQLTCKSANGCKISLRRGPGIGK